MQFAVWWSSGLAELGANQFGGFLRGKCLGRALSYPRGSHTPTQYGGNFHLFGHAELAWASGPQLEEGRRNSAHCSCFRMLARAWAAPAASMAVQAAQDGLHGFQCSIAL